jgi:hypothetical protein
MQAEQFMGPRVEEEMRVNLLRDPRVFLCIDSSNLEEERWDKRVQIRGTMTLVAGPQEAG